MDNTYVACQLRAWLFHGVNVAFMLHGEQHACNRNATRVQHACNKEHTSRIYRHPRYPPPGEKLAAIARPLCAVIRAIATPVRPSCNTTVRSREAEASTLLGSDI